MKEGIHPKLNNVCFVDVPTGEKFLTLSTQSSDKKEVIDGKEYFVIPCGTTSASHPFFTGENRLVDTEGRVDKFNKRYAKKK